MGILNVTPDSFSDGGDWRDHGEAIARGREMFEQGAAIVDVGGESTRPGALPVPEEVELQRVVPVVESLSEYGTVYIDTRHPIVAKSAVEHGAKMINDVSASLGELAGRLGVSWVAMHMQGTPGSMQVSPHYEDVVSEVLTYLLHAADQAMDCGAPEVLIDPGIGFGKSVAHNIELLQGLDRFVSTGYPVLVGASRKRFIGELTGEPRPKERLGGSVAVALECARRGVGIVRVHDGKETRQALDLISALDHQ